MASIPNMQRGNQGKAQNGKPAGWSAMISGANLRTNSMNYATQATSDSQNSLLNSLNPEILSNGDLNTVNGMNPNSNHSHLTAPPVEARQEDFPALPLHRASSLQSSTKTNIGQPDKRVSSQKNGLNQNSFSPNQESSVANAQKGNSEQRSSTEAGAQGNKKDFKLPLTQEEKYGLKYILKTLYGKSDTAEYMLATGIGLENFNLNLNDNSVKALDNFVSPWAKDAPRFVGPMKEPEFRLSDVYNKGNPPPITTRIPTLKDRTLLYIFYSMPRDVMQELAAQQLYNRDWRYHKERQLWMIRKSTPEPSQKYLENEEDIFEVFHPRSWESRIEKVIVTPETFEVRNVPGVYGKFPGQSHPSLTQAVPAQFASGNVYGISANQLLQQQQNALLSQQPSAHMYKQQVPVQFGQQPSHGAPIMPNHPQQHMQLHPTQQHQLHAHLQPHQLHPAMFNANPHFNPNSSMTSMGMPSGFPMTTNPNMNMNAPPQHHAHSRLKDF